MFEIRLTHHLDIKPKIHLEAKLLRVVKETPPKKTASISAFSQLSSKGWLWHCQLQSQEKRMLGQQIGSDTVLLFTENLKDIPHNDTFAPTVIISQLLFQEKTDSDYSWLEYNMIQMELCFFFYQETAGLNHFLKRVKVLFKIIKIIIYWLEQ